MRSFKAASSILSPSWMSMARLTFPSRLELNRPEGSGNAAPLANVILTTFLYVSPVQTMPPCEKTGVPGDVAFAHFHCSTISGSAWWMISRTFASIVPRQSPSSLTFLSMDAEADSIGTVLSCTEPTLASIPAALNVTCTLRKWKHRTASLKPKAVFSLQTFCKGCHETEHKTGLESATRPPVRTACPWSTSGHHWYVFVQVNCGVVWPRLRLLMTDSCCSTHEPLCAV